MLCKHEECLIVLNDMLTSISTSLLINILSNLKNNILLLNNNKKNYFNLQSLRLSVCL
jgi:hypothetical protein